MKLYEAKLIGIIFNAGVDGCKPDNYDHVPSYYKEGQYSSWFKIKEIIEIQDSDVESILHQYSYSDKAYGFFGDNEFFTDFYNKKVCSLNELRHQDRTIWFIDEYKTGDFEHELILQNASVSIPKIFPTSYTNVDGYKLHWLTDLHFSESRGKHGFDDKSITTKLESIISDKFKDSMNALIVSGDMTWMSTDNEFDRCVSFYQHLVSQTALTMDNIGFCPGNHDLMFDKNIDERVSNALVKLNKLQVNHKNAEKMTDDEWDYLKAAKVTQECKKPYIKHFNDLVMIQPNDDLSMGKKFLMNHQRPVELCFLNSSTHNQSASLYQGHGFIGQCQRDDAASKMEWNRGKAYGVKRVVVLHHNLLPVGYAEIPYLGYASGFLHDARATIKWCFEHDVDLILHGHTHEQSVFKFTDVENGNQKSVWIVGLGSTGADSNHLVPNNPNQLAELDFSGQNIEVQYYKIGNNNIELLGNKIELD